MSKHPPEGSNLRLLHGGKDTPSPSPRPVDHQTRIITLENLLQSRDEEITELKADNKKLRQENKLLVTGSIDIASRRIIFVLQHEVGGLRESLTKSEERREAAEAKTEAAEAEYLRLQNEYQKLLESYELSISAEDLLKMLQAETAELQSAHSVRDMLMEELAELKLKLEKTDKLMLSDLSPNGYRAVMDTLSSISFNWLQSDDNKKQVDGFKLQTTILQQWSNRRPT